jgi:hypothetical protein
VTDAATKSALFAHNQHTPLGKGVRRIPSGRSTVFTFTTAGELDRFLAIAARLETSGRRRPSSCCRRAFLMAYSLTVPSLSLAGLLTMWANQAGIRARTGPSSCRAEGRLQRDQRRITLSKPRWQLVEHVRMV